MFSKDERPSIRAHPRPVDALHRSSVGRGYLEQVRDAPDVLRTIAARGMEEGGIEENFDDNRKTGSKDLLNK